MNRVEAAILARAAKAKKDGPIEVRFWSKVDRRGEDDCWLWLAGVRRKDEGYGAFWLNGRHQPASKVAWQITYGPVADGLEVCHRCDNPRCCNPKHLFVGTRLDNNDDKVAKKRHPLGARNGCAKLTEDDVRSIRSIKGKKTQAEIAALFGVTKSTVNNIYYGPNWKWLI